MHEHPGGEPLHAKGLEEGAFEESREFGRQRLRDGLRVYLAHGAPSRRRSPVVTALRLGQPAGDGHATCPRRRTARPPSSSATLSTPSTGCSGAQ